MSKPANRILSVLAVFFLAVCFVHCDNGGSELPNELHGVVVTNNRAPAANVKVGLYSINYIPADSANAGQAWTTKTDASGKYAFKNIPSGRYNVVGLQDSLGFFRDSISVSGAAEIGRDSLGLLGTLSGTVQLQPQDEPRNAVIQVMGTDNYVNVDSSGRFTLSGLAGGFYRLRVSVSLPNYVPLFKEVQAHAGKHDTLAAPLVPFYSGIPVVLNIRTSYDTARGIAKITWHPVSYPAFLSYLVYRDQENAVNIGNDPINTWRIEDTVFYDTLYQFDTVAKRWIDSVPYALEYRVRVKAKNTNVGEPYKPAVLHTVSPNILSTRISIERLGGKFDEIFKGDTVRFVADYANAVFLNRSLAWVHGVADTLRKAGLNGKSGKDTLVWIAAAGLGLDSIHVDITDANGKPWSVKAVLNVVASRVLGNIKTSASAMEAYGWQGNILHVARDTSGKFAIGIFNLTTRRDTILSAIAKGDAAATALSGSKLYLMNARHPDFPGTNLLSYDLLSGVWGKEPNPADVTLENCAAAVGGKLVALSRYGTEMDSLKFSILDLATHVWSVKKLNRQALNAFAYGLTAQNGRIYLGSSLNGPPLTSYEEYIIATDQLSPLPWSERTRYNFGSRLVGLKGKLYNLGGTDINYLFPAIVAVLDPTQTAWLAAPDFLVGRGNPGAVGIGSSIYIVGGGIMNGYETTVEEYRPE